MMDGGLQAVERTLVIVKPDGVKRGLIGKVIQRFEDAGFRVTALKMLCPSRDQLERHFPQSEEWVQKMGEKTLEAFKEFGLDPQEAFGTYDLIAVGGKLKEWLYDYYLSGPIVILVVEGCRAIEVVRKLVGHTLPYKALPGTIRGDFSGDAPDSATKKGRVCHNIVHASGDEQEAEHEINCWFKLAEIMKFDELTA